MELSKGHLRCELSGVSWPGSTFCFMGSENHLQYLKMSVYAFIFRQGSTAFIRFSQSRLWPKRGEKPLTRSIFFCTSVYRIQMVKLTCLSFSFAVPRKSKWVRPRSGLSQPSCSSWPAALCLWQSPPSFSNILRGGRPWSPFTLWWSLSPQWALVTLWQVSTLGVPVNGALVGGGNVLLAAFFKTIKIVVVREANEKGSVSLLLCTGSFWARGLCDVTAVGFYREREGRQPLPPQEA